MEDVLDVGSDISLNSSFKPLLECIAGRVGNAECAAGLGNFPFLEAIDWTFLNVVVSKSKQEKTLRSLK
jgi:hypothetical protein